MSGALSYVPEREARRLSLGDACYLALCWSGWLAVTASCVVALWVTFFVFLGEFGFTVQRKLERRLLVFHVGEQVAEASSLGSHALRVALHGPLIHIEIDQNRIDGYDCGQQWIAVPRVNQVAFGQLGLADTAIDVGRDA